jgi:hypothetical protein
MTVRISVSSSRTGMNCSQAFSQSRITAPYCDVGNLSRDARVSAAIYSFPGPPDGNLGLQLRGIATAIDAAGDQGPWLRFTIKPEEAWCFDSRIGRERHCIDLSSLDLGPA